MTRIVRSVVLAIVAAAPAIVGAHDLAQSQSACRGEGATVVCTLTLDLLEFPNVDTDRNQRISVAELDASIARVFDEIKARVAISSDQPLQRATLTRYGIVADDHVGQLAVTYVFARAPRDLTVTSTLDQLARPEHEHLVTIGEGPDRQQAVLDATHRSVTLAVNPSPITLERVLILLAGAALIGALSYARIRGAMKR